MNEFSDSELLTLPLGRIVAVGVGHSGESIIKHIIEEQDARIELIIANMDEQMSYEKLSQELEGADMVFIIAGEKKETKTALNIAKMAKVAGAFTIGIVSKYFYFKEHDHLKLKDKSLEKFQSECDTVVVIPSDDISKIDTNAPLSECFKTMDTLFSRVISGISGVILPSGENDINLDIDDLKTVMCHQGVAYAGIGEHQGENAAYEAINHAIKDDISLKNASGVLVHFNIHPEFHIMKLATAMEVIHQRIDENAEVVFGTTTDESLPLNFIRATVIATVIEKSLMMVAHNKNNRIQKLARRSLVPFESIAEIKSRVAEQSNYLCHSDINDVENI